MKQLMGLLMLVLFSLGCGQEKKGTSDSENAGGWDIIIKGKVKFPQSGTISIREIRQDVEGKTDTIRLRKDNSFEKKIHLTDPGYYNLNFFNQQSMNLMLYKSNIEVNVDGNNQQGFTEIKGSLDHDLYNRVQQMMGESQTSTTLTNIEAEFQKAADAKDEKRVLELQNAYNAELEKGKEKIVAYLKDQPVSLGLYTLLQDNGLIDKDKHLDLYLEASEKFQKEWPLSMFSRELSSAVSKLKVTAIGQVAPEINLPNPQGDTIRLSSLRGKYVLIDFWAKWCGPCRRENPNVVKAYHKFKNKGFEIYSVSLDRTKADWVQAIQEDGLVWTHVSDLRYFECQAARDYNINAIPFSILLDKNGVIIAKNLRGALLENKLSEVLGKL